MKHINKDNLYDYAFLNEDTLQKPLRAICVNFHGYTDGTMFTQSPVIAEILGKAGIAWCFPYYSVWAWAGKSSQEFNEQVLDAVYDRLEAREDIPLISTGGSMGGLTAMHYTVFGKRKACACAVNCPVSDMLHFFENAPQDRRAFLSAHILEEGTLEDILDANSPLHFADRFPDIPYFLVYGEKDSYFTDKQRPPFVEKLQQLGVNHSVWIQPEMGHCQLMQFPESKAKYLHFIMTAAGVEIPADL